MSKKSKSANMGFGCMLLFALPFAGVGVFMEGLVLYTFLSHLTMQSWQPTPAKIVSAELKVAGGGEGGPTFQVVAQYEYDFAGQHYHGSRVTVHGGSDNVGSFHHDAHRELSRHQQTGQPFTCFVNPREPSEAILYRNVRWEMMCFYTLFVLAFGGAGFGLLTAGIIGYRKEKSEKAAADVAIAEPWLKNSQWAAGEIRSSSKARAVTWLVVAAAWNAVTAPLWFVLAPEILDKGNRYAMFGASLPTVGLILAFVASREFGRWRKYGESTFRFASVPGVVGGELAGVVGASTKIETEEGFNLRLTCNHKRTTGSGDDRSTSVEALWQDEQVVTRELSGDADASAIPVMFAIPYDCRPTDDSDANDSISWRLEVTARAPGIDYIAAFEVPVFRTADSDPKFIADESALAPYSTPADPQRDMQAAGVVRSQSPDGDGDRFVFPMGRHLGTGLASLVFLLIWNGVIWFMIHLGAPKFFPIMFGVFDLLILWATLDMLFYRSIVDVSPRGVGVRRGLFGLGRSRWIDAEDVTGFAATRGMQSGQRIYYDISATRRIGNPVTLGKRILNQRLADAVIRELKAAMQA